MYLYLFTLTNSIKMNQDEVETLIHMKMRMSKRPLNTYSQEYIQVYRQIEELCRKYCEHVCVEDEIEPTPDQVIQIHYCVFCECTFP